MLGQVYLVSVKSIEGKSENFVSRFHAIPTEGNETEGAKVPLACRKMKRKENSFSQTPKMES